MITDADLLSYAKRGLIPGPAEEGEAFLKRASKCPPLFQEAWEADVYGFTVDWVPCLYSNKKLPFWEGAATWISEEGISVQLRKEFKKGKYMGYQRKEVLSHEAVHAARCAFEEPRFEEILAYRTSCNPVRRWLGPLFRKPWESIAFLLCFPFGLYLLFRLMRDQRLLTRALKKITPSILVCLTDEEIRHAKVSDIATLRTRLISLLSQGFF